MPSTGAAAANNNSPLWQRVTLRVAQDHAALAGLDAAERAALWEKAVSTMKPTTDELAAMTKDTGAENAYMLSFVKAYKAGMPPMAQWTENTRR